LPPLQSNVNSREGKQQLSLGLIFSVSDMTMLLQMNSALHSGLLSVQVNQTPGLYAGPGVYPGPGFYPKFYGSRKGSKKLK